MGLKNASELAAAIFAAAASMEKRGGARGPVRIIGPTLKAPTRTRVFRTWRSSAPQIKQGARECARRKGGQTWAEFKAADRVRRGLPSYLGVARTEGEAQSMVEAWRTAYPKIAAAWPRGGV